MGKGGDESTVRYTALNMEPSCGGGLQQGRWGQAPMEGVAFVGFAGRVNALSSGSCVQLHGAAVRAWKARTNHPPNLLPVLRSAPWRSPNSPPTACPKAYSTSSANVQGWRGAKWPMEPVLPILVPTFPFMETVTRSPTPEPPPPSPPGT